MRQSVGEPSLPGALRRNGHQKTVQEAVMCVLSSVAAEGVESHSHLQQSMK